MGKDVIIALDFDSREKVFSFLDQFTEEKPFVKIGMELYYAEGPDIVRQIKARGHKIFLDLKLHDIPNTVKRAMAVLSRLDVDMVNLHAAGAGEMMRGALEGLTRPDGTEICYPQLLLCNMDSLSFGGLYEVLQREGGFQVNGTPEEFSFTAADGRELSFSYAYREELEGAGEVFYYMQDGEKVPLSYIPELESEQCHALTGLSFERLK